MIVNTARRVLVLLALLVSSNAYCYIDPPTFTPASPSAGEEVFINVRFGGCDGYLSQPPTITRFGDTVEIIYATVRNNFCIVPPATLTSSLGIFAAGTYAVVVKRNDVLAQPPLLSTVGTYTLLVRQGVTATPVPTLSMGSLLALVFFAMVAVALFRKGAIPILAVTCLVTGYAGPSIAGESGLVEMRSVKVLLSVERGAPTADEVLQFVSDPSSGVPPLEAFRTYRPKLATYLLPSRVEPALARQLAENSMAPRAILERYIVLHYGPDGDMREVLASLRESHV